MMNDYIEVIITQKSLWWTIWICYKVYIYKTVIGRTETVTGNTEMSCCF